MQKIIINGKEVKPSEIQMNRELMIKFMGIARDKLNITTLLTRNSDSLDFHDVAVWQIRDAMLEAYKLGFNDAEKQREVKP